MSDPTSDTSPRGRQDPRLLLVVLTVLPFLAARLSLAPWWLSGWFVLVVGVAALLIARRIALVVAVLVLISTLAASAVDGLAAVSSRPLVRSTIELVSDPVPTAFGLRMVARLDGSHVSVTVPFAQARLVEQLGARDQLMVSGVLEGRRPTTDWAISRRIVGELALGQVHAAGRSTGPAGLATEFRELIRDGARSLPTDRRVLFTGLVFGDDRGQDPIVADNFRASGLGHLLAVSGQNVVFVLLLGAPLLSRIRSLTFRASASLLILAAFGFVTRFEPSVLRAIVMASLLIISGAVGRPAVAAQVLPAAVAGVLIFDPLLAWSLAFQLSVAATLGLIVIAPWLFERLIGPFPIRAAVAATSAAQLAVAPLLFTSIGSVSAVAIPANLLAAPAAAGVMMWGLVVGPVAGLGPPELATMLHLPTHAMLWFIDGVAAQGARMEVGELTAGHLATLVLGFVVLRRVPILGRALLLIVTVVVLVAPPPLPPGTHVLADGVEVTRSTDGHDVVVLEGNVRVDQVIESLRTARVGRIDALITTSRSRATGRVVAVIVDRFDVVDVWAPLGHEIPHARVVDPIGGRVGTLIISEEPDGQIRVLGA